MEALARLVLRELCRSEEGGAGELLRLLDQSDQRRRVARDPDQPQLVPFDAQLRDIGVIGQDLRQLLEYDDRRGGFVLAPFQRAQRRRGGVERSLAAAERGGASAGDLPCQLILLLLEPLADDAGGDGRCGGT